jgi:hypothetical protein
VYYHPTEEGIETRIKARLDEIKHAKANAGSPSSDSGRKREKPGA